MPLNPEATNRMTCSKCGWTRILDATRSYRGGHTHPETGAECHEMLIFEELSPLPPEVAILGEAEPVISDQEISSLLSTSAHDGAEEAAAAKERAGAERARRDRVRERLQGEVYTGPDAALAWDEEPSDAHETMRGNPTT